MYREKVYWVALSIVAGMGPKTFRRAIERFGRPAAVFEASVDELTKIPRITMEMAEDILATPLGEVEEELLSLDEEGINVLTMNDQAYPANLKPLPDAPPVLFLLGQLLGGDSTSVAIVGSRRATLQSLALAKELAAGLARKGLTVVSGLAEGIDTAAHQGALQGGGRTIAVLGSGVRVIHPRENEGLAKDIMEQGALLSELHPNAPPLGQNLMARDRIVSGLSRAVIVVEAEEQSGSLHTASEAKKQGRLVFVIDNPSPGNKRLLREGAIKLSGAQIDFDTLAERIKRHTSGSQEGLTRQTCFL
ncbi:MAG TPA: DNA-protecting protein DprA [Chloroflexi bacterium]|nr:DNA-protecting protein DprA [Chloroflexota bacterium]